MVPSVTAPASAASGGPSELTGARFRLLIVDSLSYRASVRVYAAAALVLADRRRSSQRSAAAATNKPTSAITWASWGPQNQVCSRRAKVMRNRSDTQSATKAKTSGAWPPDDRELGQVQRHVVERVRVDGHIAQALLSLATWEAGSTWPAPIPNRSGFSSTRSNLNRPASSYTCPGGSRHVWPRRLEAQTPCLAEGCPLPHPMRIAPSSGFCDRRSVAASIRC